MNNYLKCIKVLFVAIVVIGLAGCRDEENGDKRVDSLKQYAKNKDRVSTKCDGNKGSRGFFGTYTSTGSTSPDGGPSVSQEKKQPSASTSTSDPDRKKDNKESPEPELTKEEKAVFENAFHEAIIEFLPDGVYGVYYETELIKAGADISLLDLEPILPPGFFFDKDSGKIYGVYGKFEEGPEQEVNIIIVAHSKDNSKNKGWDLSKPLKIKFNSLRIAGKSLNTVKNAYDNYWRSNFNKRAGGADGFSKKNKSNYNFDLEPNKRGERKLYYDNWLDQIFEQENLNENKFKVLPEKLEELLATYVADENEFIIPKKLHIVWVNKFDKDIQSIRKAYNTNNRYMEGNASLAKDWEKILWTNDPSKIPQDIKDILKQQGVGVKSPFDIIKRIEEEVRNGNISDEQAEKYKVLVNLVYFYSMEADYGSATDIFRYLIVYLYGGVYMDGDYEIENIEKIEGLMVRYDSYFGVERCFDVRLGNAFIATKQYGAVIKVVLDNVYRNVLYTLEIDSGMSVPAYIKQPYQWDMGIIMRTGPVALTVAFATVATNFFSFFSKENTKLLEYYYIFRLPRGQCAQADSEKKDSVRLGTHYFDVSWCKE